MGVWARVSANALVGERVVRSRFLRCLPAPQKNLPGLFMPKCDTRTKIPTKWGLTRIPCRMGTQWDTPRCVFCLFGGYRLFAGKLTEKTSPEKKESKQTQPHACLNFPSCRKDQPSKGSGERRKAKTQNRRINQPL